MLKIEPENPDEAVPFTPDEVFANGLEAPVEKLKLGAVGGVKAGKEELAEAPNGLLAGAFPAGGKLVEGLIDGAGVLCAKGFD